MSFEERIAQIIDAAMAENRQEEQETAAFESAWRNLRNSVILRLFTEAKKAIYTKGGGANDQPSNGGAELKVLWQQREYYLKFSPDKAKRQVMIRSSFAKEEPDEPYTIENLTEDVVQTKIQDFIYRIVRGKKRDDDESVYEGRGLLVV